MTMAFTMLVMNTLALSARTSERDPVGVTAAVIVMILAAFASMSAAASVMASLRVRVGVSRVPPPPPPRSATAADRAPPARPQALEERMQVLERGHGDSNMFREATMRMERLRVKVMYAGVCGRMRNLASGWDLEREVDSLERRFDTMDTLLCTGFDGGGNKL